MNLTDFNEILKSVFDVKFFTESSRENFDQLKFYWV